MSKHIGVYDGAAKEHLGQFHQHFTVAFFADILSPKNRKMLVELTLKVATK
jgi:hypothetical protein